MIVRLSGGSDKGFYLKWFVALLETSCLKRSIEALDLQMERDKRKRGLSTPNSVSERTLVFGNASMKLVRRDEVSG